MVRRAGSAVQDSPERGCTGVQLGALAAHGHDTRPDAVGQLARIHAEEAVGIARRGPDAPVLEQRLVEENGQVSAMRQINPVGVFVSKKRP